MSPLCLAAVFDILLTELALDEEITGTTGVGADANTGYKDWDTAYADDFLSETRDERHGYRGRLMLCRSSAASWVYR